MRVLVAFLSPSTLTPGWYFDYTMITSFQILSNSSLIYHPTIRRHIISILKKRRQIHDNNKTNIEEFYILPCHPLKVNRRLGGGSTCYLLHAGFLLGIFLDAEDGGEMFLRNVR
jgi:hypothetical protein